MASEGSDVVAPREFIVPVSTMNSTAKIGTLVLSGGILYVMSTAGVEKKITQT